MSDRVDSQPISPGFSAALPSADQQGPARAAFEVKALVSISVAHALEGLARSAMVADANGDPARGGRGDGRYATTTLYLDTAALDVLHKRPGFERTKLRIRRYGESAQVHLERKTRDGDRVTKVRWPLAMPGDTGAASDLFQLLPLVPPFEDQVHRDGLRPACLVCYLRTALLGAAGTVLANARLTIDTDLLTAIPGQERWSLQAGALHPALVDRAVVEFKFSGAMPALFKQWIATLGIVPGPVSKYRHCRAVLDGQTSGANRA